MLPTAPTPASPHIQRLAECQATVFRAVGDRLLDVLRTADANLPMPDTVVRTELRTAQLARQLGMTRANGIAAAVHAAATAQPAPVAPAPVAKPAKQRLQLLDDVALDADLAMSKLVRKTVEEIDPETLASLEMRIGELQGSAPCDRDSNPLGPRAVLFALYDATLLASDEAEVRLALMSLLQPHVAAALRASYDVVNERLIALGILPDVTFRVKKDAPATPRNGPEVGISQAMSLAELLPAIHGLPTSLELQRMLRGLVGRRTEPTPLAARILADTHNAFHGAAVESPVDPETLAALMALQQMRAIDAGEHDELLDGLSDDFALGADPLAALRAATADDMAALDQLTGQLVAVVLEFVLHDPAVPEAVKKQIGRLQIVAFRAALLDRTFFARRDHPFRQLLDRIAALAVDAEHAAPDSAFQNTLVRITDALVTDFRDDLAIFTEKLAELDAALDFADGTQAEAVARAIEALPELEALHGVRQRALNAINAKLHGGTPPAIVTFLRTVWVDVLVSTWRARGGEAKWQEHMTLAARLVWSLQPHPREHLAELSKALPGIVTGIKRAMEDASVAVEKRQAILEQLFECHQSIVRQARQPGAPENTDAIEYDGIASSFEPPRVPARTPLRTGFELTLVRDGEEARARIVAVGSDRVLCVLAYADGTVSTERCEEIEQRIDSGDVVLLSSPHGIVERALALMTEPDAHKVHGAIAPPPGV